MQIDEVYRCRQCGYEASGYNALKHYSDDSGGFCPACDGCDFDVIDYSVSGDGSMARLMANGQCPKCRIAMGGELKCKACGLEIVK